MQIRTSAARAHSPTLIALTALAGFAAGACLVGLTKFPSTLSKTAEPAAATASTRPAQVAPGPEPVAEPVIVSGARERQPAVAPAPWPFESATPEPREGPGAKRPDLRNAPE